MFGFGDITNVLIIAICLGSQYFLASRRHMFWGALLPAAFVIWRGTILFTTDDTVLSQILIMAFGLVFLLGQWVQGRKAFKIKQEKELLKMKAHDIL
ncbi:hypothetical protein ACTHOQ_16785 [Solibacillus silvestris]|uniref:hypothetical protein n=1 Tax=Solibacillus silvestris TaxID=76853 RepID=UPI003F7F0CA5